MNEQELIVYITSRRWFGAKTREVTQAQLIDEAVLHAGEKEYGIGLVEVRFGEGTHETYQLFRGAASADALEDPSLARELVHLIRTGEPVQAREGVVEFHNLPGFAALGKELSDARVIATEQSNTSVVFDDELILKAYRRIEAGINPELELLRFLTERAFANIPALGGWYAYVGRPMDATLGILQEFVPGGIDGWELALDELDHAPEAFLGRLHRLGEVTGSMHALLGSEPGDPNFCAEEPSVESLGLLTATVDEEIEHVFLDLPEENEAVAPILGRGEEVRERLRMLTHAGTTGRIIRHHGDYHLGQTLFGPKTPPAKPAAPGNDAPSALPETEAAAQQPPVSAAARSVPLGNGDWVILDFEGEPARSLPERRRKRSPLRDVAGMLRSFAYAASAVEIDRGVVPPADWETRAREEFLSGYLATVDPTLLPPGRESMDKLLSVFELEKAVYELRYELNTRPDWVPIPVAGILRLLEQPVGA
jgi:predicted trehalose synthase